MASSQSPNRVYFTSFDRQPTDTNTDFTITFDTPIQNSYNYEVVQASFPNLLKPFANYETILYFYHSAFFGGSIALGVPMSPVLFPGATGEAPAPSSRKVYINNRFFADGTDLATYLSNWLISLGSSWPATGSGLQPFYFANDDPTNAPTFLSSNTTGITFTNLSFTYDDLTNDGTQTMLFEDSTPATVRIASTFDYGDLNLRFPSQLGYKLGFTSTIPEAFSTTIVPITSNNNQFSIGYQSDTLNVTVSNNKFNIFATPDDSYFDPTMQVIIPVGNYSFDDFPGVLQAAIRAASTRLSGAVVTESAGTLTITLNMTGTPVNPPGVMGLNFTSGQGGNPEGPACAALLGYTTFNPPFSGIIQTTFGSFAFVANQTMSQSAGSYVFQSYTIPPNDYTPTALAAILESTINNPVINPILPFVLGTQVTQAGNILTFDFTGTNPPQNVANYAVYFNPADPSQQGAKTAFGFTMNLNTTPSSSVLTAPNQVQQVGTSVTPAFHQAPDPINLTRTSLVYFASSLSSGESLASAGRKDILFAIAMTAGIGQIQQYQSSLSGIVVNRPPSTIRNIRLTLLDDNFQVLEPLPQNAAVVVEIHFAYNEDLKASNRDSVTTNVYA